MLKKLLFRIYIIISITLLASNINSAQTKWTKEFYDSAEFIELRDDEAYFTGSLVKGEYLKIGIKDVALFNGHLCPGSISGFILTKLALQGLFGDEISERGNVKISASGINGIVNVASYIVGIYSSDILLKSKKIVIDKSLSSEDEGFVMIFQRKDTGKMIKTKFNKTNLFGPGQMKEISEYKKRFNAGNATDEEIISKGDVIQSIIYKAFKEKPKNVYTVEECKDYKFPD